MKKISAITSLLVVALLLQGCGGRRDGYQRSSRPDVPQTNNFVSCGDENFAKNNRGICDAIMVKPRENRGDFDGSNRGFIDL